MAAFPNLQSRHDILDSATRIKQLTQQPSDFLTDLLVQQQQFACIEWIHRFNLLQEIPLPPGSISYPDAAAKLGVSVSTLRAVARMAMTANLLSETKDGKLAHNTLSAVFVEDEDLAAWLSYLINSSIPCMRAFAEATQKWDDSTKRNETSYNIATGTDLSFFEHLAADPARSTEFGKYMKSQSTVHAGVNAGHLVTGYDWAKLGEATIVDVGGNSGVVSTTLAKNFPKLRFVVQDLPGPIYQGRVQAEALSAEIAGRIDFQEHDFFLPQPVKEADVYLLRMILHDWAEEDAVRILRPLVEVMKEGSRIIIMDMVLPVPGAESRTLEAALRQKDLTMRQVMNAREREVEDWYALVDKVDTSLRIAGIRRPEGSQHSIIEITRLVPL